MANRYQERPFSADDAYDHGGDPHAPARTETDPLAELARLIGQTDPFSSMGRANHQVQPRGDTYDQHQPAEEADDGAAAGPPPWIQRAVRHEAPQQDHQAYEASEHDHPSAVHPLHRYAQPQPELSPDYNHEPAYEHAEEPLDPSRYDDALYGQIDSGLQETPYEQAYSDDPYAYHDGEEAEEPPAKRRGGLATVVVVFALAVVGTGAAFGYRTYMGSPRSGEPPIIKADTSPTKVIPAPADGSAKVPDRLASGDGTEKIVPREEAPVDVNANTKSGPRMVFPPLNQNANPPSVASVAPNGGLPPPSSGAGTMPNNEPRKIKTFSVRGDETDTASVPTAATTQAAPAAQAAAKSAAAVRTAATNPRTAPAPSAAAPAGGSPPMSLAPQATPPAPVADPHTRVATTAPMPVAPNNTSGGAGGYLVQVSSQRNEADAQASYRVLQGKFPGVLGSRSALIRRADLGEKGVYYRAMVGPFGSPDEASQFCGSLKTAGGQCVVQRN
jgi:SPOR domain